MVKRIPFPFLAVVHFISLGVPPSLMVPFVLNMSFPTLAIPLATIITVWAFDAAVFVLSFAIWWNKPLRIGQEGIAKRNGPVCRYEDASAFSFKKGLPTQYGRGNGILTIRYKNGDSISFERNEDILKTINCLCLDKAFITKLNECIK